MPDWWEIEYGLNPNKDDAERDKDSDGVSNLDEYLGDDQQPGNDDYSDPTDKNSVPHIKKAVKDDDQDLTVVWIVLIIVVVLSVK